MRRRWYYWQGSAAQNGSAHSITTLHNHREGQCGPASKGTGASAHVGSGPHAAAHVGCAAGWFSAGSRANRAPHGA